MLNAGRRRNKDHGHFELHLFLAVVTDGVTTGEEWRLYSSSTKRALNSVQAWHFTPYVGGLNTAGSAPWLNPGK